MFRRSFTFRAVLIACAWPWSGASPAWAQPAGAGDMLSQLTRDHAYALTEAERRTLDELNRQWREAQNQARRRNTDEARESARRRQAEITRRLLETLEQSSAVQRITIRDGTVTPPAGGSVQMPGTSGALLMRIDCGNGEPRLVTHHIDFSQIPGERALVEVQVGSGGTTWAVVGLTNLPAKRTHTSVRFTSEDGRMLHWPVDLVTADRARLRLKVLGEDGAATPAMVRLTWRTGGDADVRPTNAVDIGPQFDAQGSPASRRVTNLPGLFAGEFWCIPGPVDMMISPGEYRVTVRRGIEHVPVSEAFTARPGETIERNLTVKRWVDMRTHGWYSGDDHVHNRILSDDDARRLMTWVKAEDIHLANVVKMGDIYRTWFDQRGFGREYRVIDGDYILSPGQECPRTHGQIGHCLAMNITDMVRDTDRYYSYDWVARTVHEQGGLFGYAHVNSGQFFVHRDMSMNIPAGQVDFVELLQFFHLGTELYYEFLNLGYKVTASAGSDVPWGGTVGEVRLYARVDQRHFGADTWFEAVRKGRTFVSNGPMIEFRVEDALPGDEIRVAAARPLKIKARAWGDPGRTRPIRLEIVALGEVIRTAQSSGEEASVEIEFEKDAGHGFWIAARAEGADGTKAHTTPVYVQREGLRFWKYDAAESLIEKRLSHLNEVERIVRDARSAAEKGGARTREAGEDRAIGQLALQGDDLLRRVESARRTFAELRQTAEQEKPLRSLK